jgi:exodeoxyribonuclease V gamma subunit
VSRSLLAPREPTTLVRTDDAGEVACRLGAPDASRDERQDCAIELLADLVALRDLGLCDGLPLPCETAGVYVDDTWDYAAKTARSHPVPQGGGDLGHRRLGGFDKADRDPANRQVLGELTFAELFALPPTEHEEGDGWFADRETGRFGRLARRVWWPLRSAEVMEDRP